QSGKMFYLFKAPVSELKNILTVKVREEDEQKNSDDPGYQRIFSPSRKRQIAKYIDDGNVIPLNILVSFTKATISADKKTISIPNNKNAGWIIDGQHRFLGAVEAKKDLEIAVSGFVGLDIAEQINQFVTINKTARGVPSSLYIDLLPHLHINKTPREIASERAADLAQMLKKDEESPFYGKIVSTTKPKKGELSLANFARKVMPLVMEGSGPLHVYNEIEQATIISNYYKGFSEVFPREFSKEKSKFFQTIGFGGLIEFLPNVFNWSISINSGSFTVANVKELVGHIKDFDFAGWDSLGTGSKAEREAAKDLAAAFEEAMEVMAPGKKIKLN
ncbi:DGQHR domain-containing protein, partial [Marinobacter sp.]|uniref:DGQHR domain-containing protein n=1 Tax=Marinobacter sp. TaxID=50741 RepID=UPI00329879D4